MGGPTRKIVESSWRGGLTGQCVGLDSRGPETVA